jgi:hypothetical protein
VRKDGGEVIRVLLGCGAAKLERPAAAIELYTGTLYRKALACAQGWGGPWRILSARWSLLEPSQVIVPYDATLRTVEQRRVWSTIVAHRLLCSTEPRDVLIVLASSPYVDGWAPGIRKAGRVVLEPMRGLQIGERMRWLSHPPPLESIVIG